MAERHDGSATRSALQRLPMFVPSASLWPRVLAGQHRRRRAQVWRRAATGVIAAAAFAAVAIVTLPRAAPSLQQEMAAGQRESQALEQQWLQVAAAQPGDAANLVRMHMIDAELQAAYDRGAGAPTIAPLWRQRNQALRGLIAWTGLHRAEGTPILTHI